MEDRSSGFGRLLQPAIDRRSAAATSGAIAFPNQSRSIAWTGRQSMLTRTRRNPHPNRSGEVGMSRARGGGGAEPKEATARAVAGGGVGYGYGTGRLRRWLPAAAAAAAVCGLLVLIVCAAVTEGLVTRSPLAPAQPRARSRGEILIDRMSKPVRDPLEPLRVWLISTHPLCPHLHLRPIQQQGRTLLCA